MHRRLIAVVILVTSTHATGRAAERGLNVVRPPGEATAIDGCYDASGNLHLLSVRDGRCFYRVRDAGQATFGPEREIPAPVSPQCGGERRPRLMIDKSGRLFAMWPVSGGMALMRSDDRGQSWSPRATESLTRRSGVDVCNAALSEDGMIHLVWTGEHDALQPDDPVAQHLYMASSRTGGDSFDPPRALTAEEQRACPCCMPAIATEGGRVYVAFRSSVASVKETVLLRSEDSGRSFTNRRLSDHGWVLEGCPMAGPSVAAAGPHVVVSWTNREDMHAAASSDGGRTFSKPVRLGRGRFHQVAASSSGQILQVWDEGHQTGLWWRDQDRPAPRLDIAPGGILLGTPAGDFDLLVGEPE